VTRWGDLPSRDEATRKLRSGSRDPLLRVEGLCAQFAVKQGLLRRTVGRVRALDGVDLRALRGQSLAVVGEPGAGKTTLARAICRLVPATAGKVLFEGKDLLGMAKPELRSALAQIQLVTAETFSVADPLRALRALSDLTPKVLILDEPFAALADAARLSLFDELRRLRDQHAVTCLLLTQRLELALGLCDEALVLHAGQIVETGATASLVSHPHHPYTRSLLSAQRLAAPVRSEALDSAGPGVSACRFRARCPRAFRRCAEEEPALFAVPGGLSRCFLDDPDAAGQ
jgi:oligopeptide transport system ATP-binding protein